MNTALTQRKYRLGLRWAADVGRCFGVGILIGFAALQFVQLGLRTFTPFEEDLNLLILRYLPFVLTAIGWVYLSRTFPLAIASGMTRKEYFAAFAVFSAIVVAAGVAFMQLVKLVHNLLLSDGTGSLDLYGMTLLETLIRMAVYFTVGAAAGAIMARFNARPLGAVLAGLMVSLLLFRPIPLELVLSEFFDGGAFVIEYPGSEELLAPIDAVLTVVFVLIVWLALARAPMPHKKA